MDEVMFLKFGFRYGPNKLKGKYHRMRSMHTKFNELINNTGVTWSSTTGLVSADDSLWDAFFKRDKIFKTFKKKGCKNYSLLNLVFSSSTASGVFRNASSSVPQTPEEEQMIEQEYLGGAEMGENEGVGGDSGGCESSKRGHLGKRTMDVEDVTSNRRVKKKNSGSEKCDVLVEVWSQSLAARKEKDLAKAERYKSNSNEAASSVGEKYSIEECTNVLNSLPGVSSTSYNKALQFFVSLDWRKFFMSMTEERKIG
ncbi:hypothetical protein POM88_031359 [Heracleum sosnowskyi]|uniref:Myb/SANT-like domain-containing protein n=1 Tax=Heracleum sosnowskyi TaxID=360622 RepID=A0AAD8MJ22_9APIA|nr:hypothetical protein POM88_031359 [Heracleum sosnowskyi]